MKKITRLMSLKIDELTCYILVFFFLLEKHIYVKALKLSLDLSKGIS